jgi:type I restriction enzyme, S subunit
MEKNNLPSTKNWLKIKLGDLATTITKGSTPTTYGFKYLEKGIPFLKIENIDNDRINKKSIKQFISGEAHNFQKRSQLKEGDILFSIAGTIGKTCIVTKENIPCNTNQALAIVSGTKKYLLPKFLKLQLLSSLSFSLKSKARGGAMNNISLGDLKNIDILLPNINEQNRIVEKIEELFSGLEKATEELQKVREQLKVYRQSVLKAAFEGKLTEEWRQVHKNLQHGDVLLKEITQDKESKNYIKNSRKSLNKINNNFEQPLDTEISIPDIWKRVYIENISYNIQYGFTASASKKQIGPKILRITDIQNNKVDWNNVPHCKIQNDEKNKYILEDGDIIFARTGATVGKSFLIKGLFPESIFASYLIRLKLSKFINKLFVYYFFQSLIYWKQIIAGQVGTGQPNFNGTKLGHLKIHICSLEEQNQIVQEIESRLSVCDKIEESVESGLKKIKYLRQSILKKAFEGKLVSQDPEDLPASELLKEIKIQKEKIQNNSKKKVKA